jgi:hypothetical protein
MSERDHGSTNSTGRRAEAQSIALYVNEKELHRRIAPHIGLDAFRSAIKARLRIETAFPRSTHCFAVDIGHP